MVGRFDGELPVERGDASAQACRSDLILRQLFVRHPSPERKSAPSVLDDNPQLESLATLPPRDAIKLPADEQIDRVDESTELDREIAVGVVAELVQGVSLELVNVEL